MTTPTITVVPTVSECIDELERETGQRIAPEVAQRFFDISARRVFANRPRGVTERTQATLSRLGPDFVTDAIDRQMSLSTALEIEDPTDDPYERSAGIDAFQRQLRAMGIRTVSSRESGVRASTLDDLDQAGPDTGGGINAGRCLSIELARRAYMEGTRSGTSRFGPDMHRFYASNSPLSTVLTPEFTMSAIGAAALRQPILNQMVAIETGVPQGVFNYVYIDEQQGQESMRRVPLGADIPTVKLTVTDRSGQVYQYGVAVEVQDAAMRRMSLDMLRFHFARIGQRDALDKEIVVHDTAIAGDGNANTAAVETNLVADLGGTSNLPEAAELFEFLGLYEATGQFYPTISIAPSTVKTAIRTATFGSTNHPLFLGSQATLTGAGGPEEQDHPPIYGRSYAPTGKAVYMDGTQAIGMAFETGSRKTETDRYIKRLADVVAISEVVGFWVIDQNATRVFDITN